MSSSSRDMLVGVHSLLSEEGCIDSTGLSQSGMISTSVSVVAGIFTIFSASETMISSIEDSSRISSFSRMMSLRGSCPGSSSQSVPSIDRRGSRGSSATLFSTPFSSSSRVSEVLASIRDQSSSGSILEVRGSAGMGLSQSGIA